MEWMPIEEAKKDADCPILIWFDHDKDRYYDGESGRLTDYGANAESGDFMRGKGICIAIWQDGFQENDGWEYGNEYWVPGGWFAYLNGEATDYVANATHWMPLPSPLEEL